MSRMPGAFKVHNDEPVYRLMEVADSGRRLQFIIVERNDRMAVFKRDAGADHGEPPIMLTLLWEHTVGEALEMADQQREDARWNRLKDDLLYEGKFEKTLLSVQEQALKERKNISQFGPGLAVQRNR